MADFIKVWNKVMMLDRYDVKGYRRHGPMRRKQVSHARNGIAEGVVPILRQGRRSHLRSACRLRLSSGSGTVGFAVTEPDATGQTRWCGMAA